MRRAIKMVLPVLALAAGVTGLTAAVPSAAQAQCVECSMQIFNSTISGVTTYNNNVDRVNREEDRARQRRAAARASAGAASGSIEDRVLDAAMAPLAAEANRRVARDGRASAEAWYVAAGREIGGQAGSLMPEYRRRVAADGQSSADAWYVAAAGELSRRYIQDGR